MAINVPIISEFVDKGIKKAITEFESLEGPAQKAGFMLEKAFLPASAALAGLSVAGFSFAKIAAEDEESAARLAGQLRRSTGATDDNIAAVEAQIAAMEMVAGVADIDLRQSLGRLVSQTGNTEEAFDGLELALDIAAATGKPLSMVTESLTRAYGGQTEALRRLDPQLESMIKDGAELDDVLDGMRSTFGGANEEMMAGASGGFKRMQLQIDNTKEAIGFAVLPLIEQFLPALQSLAQFGQENAEIIGRLGIVVAGFAAAIVGVNMVMKAFQTVMLIAKAATLLFNIVLAANPIVLIVLAVIALIAIFVALELRFGIVSKAVEALGKVFGVVKDFVVDAWNVVFEWFRTFFGYVKDIAKPIFEFITWPHRQAVKIIAGIIRTVVENFDNIVGKVRDIAGTILHWVTWPHRTALEGIKIIFRTLAGLFTDFPQKVSRVAQSIRQAITKPFTMARDLIKGVVDRVTGFFRNLGSGIADVFHGIGSSIYEPFKWAFNQIARFWNSTVGKLSFSVPSWVPGIGGRGFSMPQIPHLADGGIVTGPTLALIGEAGPEAVVPLDRRHQFGGHTINITVTSANPDAVIEAIRTYERRNGTGYRQAS